VYAYLDEPAVRQAREAMPAPQHFALSEQGRTMLDSRRQRLAALAAKAAEGCDVIFSATTLFLPRAAADSHFFQ